MKKILAGLLFLSVQLPVKSQLSAGAEGMWVAANTPVVIDSLGIEASAEWTVSNNQLQLSSAPVPGTPQASIRRVYKWASPVTLTGRWYITYKNMELNGNAPASLQLAWSVQADYTGFTTTTGSTATANNVNNLFSSTTWRQLTAVSNNSILPVGLLSFTATRAANSQRVILSWTVTEEINIAEYVVQVAENLNALNNGVFITLGHVPARNRPGEDSYTFYDDTPGKIDKRYYRLLIREVDGSYRYSVIRTVTFDGPQWQAYPNPFINQFVLKGQARQGRLLTWKIYNAAGTLVKQGQTRASGSLELITVDLREMAAGLYLAELISDESRQNFRLIKQ